MSKEFKPYVPAESTDPEMTLKAVLLGVALSALFGAANAYLAMRAGQTIAATIPAAVIAIAAFRLPFFRGGVLEQNITRTAASVGEALVAGVAFTVPAFLLGGVWPDLSTHFWDAAWLMLAGGLLGIFFIIVLRRPLCVDSDLPFPEATACVEVVKAGQHGTTEAPRFVFGAMGLGAALQFFTNSRGFTLFRESINGFLELPRVVIRRFDSSPTVGDVAHTGAMPYATPLASPALMGIGYIVGPRLAAINFSGTVFAWWVLIPLVLFIDPDLPRRLGAPAGAPVPWDAISQNVWFNVVRPIAVGTMLVSAVYTLYSMRESLLASVRGAMASTGRSGSAAFTSRLDRDIPLRWIVISVVALVIPIGLIYYRFTGQVGAAVLAALVMTVTGFVLSAVAVRFVFTSTSLEGRSFWIVLASPIAFRSFLREKFCMYIVPLLVLAETLVVVSNLLLKADAYLMLFAVIVILLITCALTGLGVGLGAMYARFEYDNIAQTAASAGGILYMVLSLGFIGMILILAARPLYVHLYRKFLYQQVGGVEVYLCYGAIVGLCLLTTLLPLRLGCRALERLEF